MGRVHRRRPAIALGVVAFLFAAAPGLAENPPAPDSTIQPLKDGCQRNPGPLLVFAAGQALGGAFPSLTPEWAYVYRDATPRVVEGIAHSSSPAGGDLPAGHSWYDMNSNVKVDPGYEYLLGGEARRKTGNYAGDGEDTGKLHVEWETGTPSGEGTVPPFVWATEGDRVKLWGSWVWDCGHWGQNFEDPDYFLPGTGETAFSTDVPGEGTEFHPMRAEVVTRARPYLPRLRENETDVFISTDGTNARAEEECARLYPSSGAFSYGSDYTACFDDPNRRRQPVNDRDYSFFVPAPPRPSRRSRLRYRVVEAVRSNGPRERVKVLRNGLAVTVPFKGFGGNTEKLVYGKSFFVGWRGPSGRRPAHVQVRFKRLTVVDSLDGPGDVPSSAIPPGEWGMYVDVNGYWKYLNDWAPGLDGVNDGQSFDFDRTVDLYVPRGRGLRVFVHGRECDLPQIHPCPDILEGADDNDSPGDATESFFPLGEAFGDQTLRPKSGNWQLTYSVRPVR